MENLLENLLYFFFSLPVATPGSALAAALAACAFISASFFCVGVIRLRSPGFYECSRKIRDQKGASD